MSLRSSDDILLPPELEAAPRDKVRLVAFVPIAVALIGVGAILFGGLTARDAATITLGKADTDPVVTGSVETPAKDVRSILEMLDR